MIWTLQTWPLWSFIPGLSPLPVGWVERCGRLAGWGHGPLAGVRRLLGGLGKATSQLGS